MRELSNWLLAVLICVTYPLLLRGGDRSISLLIGIIIAILAVFHLLILGLRQKGHRAAPELLGRTMTFWWMLALFLVALTTHRAFTFALMALLCGLSIQEYFSVRERKPELGSDLLSPALGWAVIAAGGTLAYLGQVDAFLALTPVSLVLVLPVGFVLRDEPRGAWRAMAFSAAGVLLLSYGLGHTLLLAGLGAMPVIYCFFLTEIRDLISYWLGKGLAGLGRARPKSRILRALNYRIAEQVSPNKSWGVGILSALLLMAIAAWLAPLMPEFPAGRMTAGSSAALGLLIGALGLMGDLVFSLLKRDLGVKDSGTSMPGGTGVLDRVDSLVLTVPATFHFLYWFYIRSHL